MKKIYLSSLLFLTLMNCQSPKDSSQKEKKMNLESNVVSCISEPFSNLKLKPQIFKVSAVKATIINLKNGSKIQFPENCFVDKNGKLIKGEVEIKWNEYHSLTDILLSGITMKYDSLGTNQDLISGGMFTIDGSQNNNSIEIAPNKEVKVDIASINDTPCMNFYELDTNKGTWKYETTKTSEIKKQTLNNQTSELSILDIQLNTDSFPSLKNQNIIGWKTKSNLSNQQRRMIKNSDSQQLKLLANEAYEIVFARNKKEFSVEVEPYLMEDVMKNSKTVEKEIEGDYQNLLEVQNEMEKAICTRSINIKGFGTYNWDICNKIDREKVIAKVNFPFDMPKNNISYYLITPKDNSLVRYSSSELINFSYNPKSENCLVAILPDNSLFCCNAKQFKRTQKTNNTLEFELEKSDIELNDQGDLSSALKELF